MPVCPRCKKDAMTYLPWLGQMWSCQECDYRGPIVLEMHARALKQLLREIPKGKVTTYKELARVLGAHQRAVASMLSKNDTGKAPCYKVVRSDGKVGGYSGCGGARGKIKLLKKDGIEVKAGKVDLKKKMHRFKVV